MDSLLSPCPLWIKDYLIPAPDAHDNIDGIEEKLPNENLEFGRKLVRTHFLLDPNIYYLNHGSYGAALQMCIKLQRHYQDRLERNPLRFMDTELPVVTRNATAKMAAFVGVDPADLVFVTNATTGVNAVLRSLKLFQNHSILIFNTTYGAVKKTVHLVQLQTGAKVFSVQLDTPFQDSAEIISRFESTLEETVPKPTVAIIDHVISVTATVLPVKELTAICRKHGILALIDGAHAVGQIPLNISDIDPDFYVSNAHKWLCTPKGCAFLYAKKEVQSLLHPQTISHGYPSGFQQEFYWNGTADHSAFLASTASIDFFNAVSPEKIFKRNHELAIWAAHLLANRWETRLLNSDDLFGSMATVCLPRFFERDNFGARTLSLADIGECVRTHLRKRSIEAMFTVVDGELCIRISAQIYNETGDFEVLAQALNEIFLLNEKQLSEGVHLS